MNNTRLSTIIQYQTLVFTVLLPLFFLPNFSDFYVLPKTLISIIIATSMVITTLYYSITQKQLIFNLKLSYIPVGLILLAYSLSVFIQSPNPNYAWQTNGLLLFSLATIYIIASNNLKQGQLVSLKYSFIASSSIISLITIYQILGISTETGLSQLSWLNNKLWNPTGSPLSLIFFSLAGASISFFLALKKPISTIKSSFLIFLTLIQSLAVAVVINEILPGKDNSILMFPYSMGYSVSIDTLKTIRTALFGFGPENFLPAFTKFKPVAYNNSDSLWNIRFLTNSNILLHALSTLGLIGLIGWILTLYFLFRESISQIKKAPEIAISTIIVSLSLLLITPNATLLAIVFIIMIIQTIHSDKNWKTFTLSSPAFLYPLSLALIIVASTGLFYTFKYSIADIHFRRSVNALSQNQAKEAYDLQVKAINANPYQANYRIAYSQTNLALATSLSKKENLTEADSQNILQLIQQSIREAKAAVQINPQNVNAWENLAGIYKQLINFANNSERFAILSYEQALSLDPRNPRLWVDYGGLLISLNQYDAATNAFRQAIALKPNYANAHFNLANSYKAQQKYAPAYQAIQRVLNLVNPTSPDYSTATTESENIKKLLEESQASAVTPPVTEPEPPISPNEETTLTKPEPAPERPEEIETIDLNEDASPENLVTPSPIPTVSPTTVPTPTKNNPELQPTEQP